MCRPVRHRPRRPVAVRSTRPDPRRRPRLSDRRGRSVATPLEFVDVRRLIDERLESLPGRPDYFRGGITVSSLTPLRWIPFRVVCLLGMDQSAFASTSAPGDDLAAASPELGDPDPRAEMRQSLLEAVLAAGDHLIVVRDGHDVRTNQEIPRSVVVAELFDAVTLAGRSDAPGGAGRAPRDRSSPPVVRPSVLRKGRAGSGAGVGLRHQEPGRGAGPPRSGVPPAALPGGTARAGGRRRRRTRSAPAVLQESLRLLRRLSVSGPDWPRPKKSSSSVLPVEI